MAEQKVIVVTEVAPRLKKFEGAAARAFLREYIAYENRLDATDAQTPLKRCIEPEDLETLLQCSEDMPVQVVRPPVVQPERAAAGVAAAAAAVPAPAAVGRGARGRAAGGNAAPAAARGAPRRDLQTPVRAMPILEEDGGEDSEEGEGEEEDVPDRVEWMSNAHIEAMIIFVLGPDSQADAKKILQDIKISGDTPFAHLGIATNFVREWKDALRWCKNYLPREKVMNKVFLREVRPKKLASTLEDLDLRQIRRLRISLVTEYNKCVKAKRVLTGMEAPSPVATKPAAVVTKPAAVVTKPPREGTGAAAGGGTSAPASTPWAKGAKAGTLKKHDDPNWKLKAKCFRCNKIGHIAPDCPDGGAVEGAPVKTKKLGAILRLPDKPKGPYLAVDVGGVDDDESAKKMRLLANMDSGAECNVVGRKWAQHLEQHGAVVRPLSTPVSVEWLDKKACKNINEAVELKVQIAECKSVFTVTFLVVDWDIDYLVVGWDTLTQQGILKQLEDFLIVQERMNVSGGFIQEDENMIIENMDGQRVTSDSLRFMSDEPSGVAADSYEEESVMDIEQKKEMSLLIEEYTDVFDELPAGSALVEPMDITPKEGWKRPPMEPFRRYSPKVENAIKFDLQKQLDAGVIEESDHTNGCHVHAVPKPDSESGYRFCVDYRPVNSGVQTEPYPLPPIATILLFLSMAIFFARVDLKSGYWQFPVTDVCKEWVAFYALGKIYTCNVVPMGFVQSSFHVQRAMCSLFAEHFDKGISFI